MNRRLWIAGTGKMAHNVGLYFLRRGFDVTWLSAVPERLAGLQRRVQKTLRESPAATAQFRALSDLPLPPADIVLEATAESLAAKRAVAEAVLPHVPDTTLIASLSSSLLPADIHPRCLGVHFFYPVELTAVAEVIAVGQAEDAWPAVEAWLRPCGIRMIRQDNRSAFAVNRLLLPLQNECLRLLAEGWSADDVDKASATPLTPFGQLAFMDSVGLDVVRAAADNYAARMNSADAAALAALREGLAGLVGQGKRGRKNANGFLVGEPLPVPHPRRPPADAETLRRVKQRFLWLALNSCLRFLEDGQLSDEDLEVVLTEVFHADSSLRQAMGQEPRPALAAELARMFDQTGLPYWIPARALGPGKG